MRIKQYPLPELLDFYEAKGLLEQQTTSNEGEHLDDAELVAHDVDIKQLVCDNDKPDAINTNDSALDVHTKIALSTDLKSVEPRLDTTMLLSIDIDEIKKASFAEGLETARKQYDDQKEKLRHSAVDALMAIVTKLKDIDATLQMELREISYGCAELAITIAEKIIGVSIGSNSAAIIKDFLKENLPLLYSEPVVQIKVSEQDFEQIEHYIKGCIKEGNIATNIAIIPSSLINPADCIIDFKNGTITKNNVLMLEELRKVLTNYTSDKNSSKLDNE